MDAKKRAALAAALLAVAGAVSLFLGMFAADPFRTIQGVQALRLRHLGARQEFFRAKDGTGLRTWAIGSSSARVPVVLLHGLGATGDYWTDLVPDLKKAGRTAYLPDAPGSGGSDKPKAAAGYGLANRVAAVSALVEAMGLEKIDLVGHSLGGWTAARFAIENPGRIRKLVLVDAGGINPPPAPGTEEAERAKFSPPTRRGGYRLVDLLFFKKPFPVTGFLADAFARNYRSENVTRTLDALRPEDWLLSDLERLPEGTVVIWGEKETLFPVDEVRPVVGRIPGVRFFVITGVGHDGPLEATRAFNDALLSILGSEPGSSGKGTPEYAP